MKHRKPNKLRLTVHERTGRYASPLGFNWSWSVERRFEDSRVYSEVAHKQGYGSEIEARQAGRDALKLHRSMPIQGC